MPTENSGESLENVEDVHVTVESENQVTGILSSQELVHDVLAAEVTNNPSDLGKLTAQDLEDLEKIQAELDSLTSSLPVSCSSDSSLAVNITNINEVSTTQSTFLEHASYSNVGEVSISQDPTPSSGIIIEESMGGSMSIAGDQVTVINQEDIMTQSDVDIGIHTEVVETELQDNDNVQYGNLDENLLISDSENQSSFVVHTSLVDEAITKTDTIQTQDIANILESSTNSSNAATSAVTVLDTSNATVTSFTTNTIGGLPISSIGSLVGPSTNVKLPMVTLNALGNPVNSVLGTVTTSVLGVQSSSIIGNQAQGSPFTVVNVSNASNLKGGKQVMLIQKPLVSTTGGTSLLAQSKLINASAGKSTVTTTIIPDAKLGVSAKKSTPILVPVSIAQSPAVTGATTMSVPISLAGFKGDLPIKVIMSQAKGAGANTGSIQLNSSTMNLLQTLSGKNIFTGAGGQFLNKTVKIVSAPSGTQFTTSASGTIGTLTGSNFISLANQANSPKIVQQQQPTILLASPTKSMTGLKGNPQIIRAFSGSPNNKQNVVLLSPVKGKPGTFQNLTLKSPQKIAPAPSTVAGNSKFTIVTATSSMTSSTVSTAKSSQGSLQKVILRPIVPGMKPGSVSSQVTTIGNAPGTVKQVMVPVSRVLSASSSGMQPIQVPGNKFNYVRLVSAPVNQGASTSKTVTALKSSTLVPVTSMRTITPAPQSTIPISSATGVGNQVRLTVNVARQSSALINQANTKTNLQPRLIVPNSATRGTIKTSSASIGTFPAGSLIQTGTTSTGQPSYVMVSAQYVAQLQNQNSGNSKALPVIQPAPTVLQGSTNSMGSSFVPIAAAATTTQQSFDQTSATQMANSILPHHVANVPMRQMNGRAPPQETIDNRPRKPCNCTKSQCLKLYCDCFANGEFCYNCNCNNCYNNLEHEEDRQKAIKSCLDRNPMAFHPKIGKTRKGKDGDHERRHTKGCNCKRSGCLKNYCECYEAKILCTNLCRCSGCKNFEDSNERKTLMHLADAAEVRVQQQAAAKDKISSQLLDLPSRAPIISLTGERLPFSFITQEVTEATCDCMLARAEEGERNDMSIAVLEKEILEEFGRCLKQIIECSNKTGNS